MQLSKIGWCDYSGGGCPDLNFVRGCAPVSEGCEHCYAKAIYERFGKDFSEVVYDRQALERLLYKQFWNGRTKRGDWQKPICFVCDTGDLFHESVPSSFIHDALGLMSSRQSVTWVVLTKRAKRMAQVVTELVRKYSDVIGGGFALSPNIWLGVTVENQARFDERVPLLLSTPARMRFVSLEPLLGPVDVSGSLTCDGHKVNGECCEQYAVHGEHYHGLDWVIVGAESGPKRRPFDVRWAEDVKRQCDEAGIPMFGKQDSGLRPGAPLLFDGQECKAWPAS